MTATSTFWFRCRDKLSNPLASIGYGNRCRHQTMYQMGTPCWMHVDITWIRRRPNFDKFPCHFHILFQCNFSDQIIHVVSMNFFRHNFDDWKIHIVSMYFFRRDFDGQIFMLFPCTFFGLVSLVEKFLTQFRWSNIPNIHVFHVLFLLQFQWSKNPRRFHVIFPTWF